MTFLLQVTEVVDFNNKVSVSLNAAKSVNKQSNREYSCTDKTDNLCVLTMQDAAGTLLR